MANKKAASFVKGALILAIASILVKVIGAVFRIPLTNLVGDYTMGLYSYAYRYYSILLTIATAGIPIAISKMVSESRALGRGRETTKIFRTAMGLCVTIGLAGTLVLMGASGVLADKVIKDANVVPSIIALSPAVLFMAVTAGFRGYFQGHENMVPTALSQIIEALSRLLIGLALAWVLMVYGFEEKFISAGVILGITIGTVLTVILMVSLVIRKRIKEGKLPHDGGECRKSSQILKAILAVAVPVTLGSLVMNLTTTIDSVLIPLRLADMGYDSVQRTTMYSIYDNYTLPLFNLVPSIIISLNVSVTPTISAAHAVRDYEKLSKTILSALRIVVIFTLPAAVGISVLSKPILTILYKTAESVAVAAPILSVLGLASFFLCASSLTSTSMQALGRANLPLITMLTGAVVKVLANYFLIAIPGVELLGAAIGTVLCYVAITVLNMIFLRRVAKFKPPVAETFLRPIVSCAAMGLVVYFAYKLCLPLLGNLISVAVSIALGVVVYFAAMIISRGITRDDVVALPKGDKIAARLFHKK